MNRPITVVVSEHTRRDFNGVLPPGVELREIHEDGGTTAPVLWRRQHDRTAWAVESLERLPHLTWIHTDTAGIDRLPLESIRARGITLSNASSVHAGAVSEWALGALLLTAKGLDQTVRDSDRGVWSPSPNRLLRGRKVLILGLGQIGSALAELCTALGMTVVGVSRSGAPHASATRTYRACDPWVAELSDSGYVINCLPLTGSTSGMVNGRVLAELPPHAWFINVGRGDTVVELDLISALIQGALAGAVLDTVTHEPLDPQSVLWQLPNVIVSAHVAARSDQADTLTQAWFLQELTRHLAGQGPLGLVDVAKGY